MLHLMLQRALEGRAGHPIPIPQVRRMAAAAQYGLAVRAEGHGSYRALVRQWVPEQPSGRRLPQPRCLVVAAGHHGLAIGAEDHGIYHTLVVQWGRERPTGRHLPQPRRKVVASGQQSLTVRAEGHGIYLSSVLQGYPK